MKIAVVGAGIIGMTSALAIRESFPESKVIVFAEFFSPETTGDGSAGLWGPYVIGESPENPDILRWSKETFKWMESFWKSPLAPEVGITLIPVIKFTMESNKSKPAWSSIVYGYHELNMEYIERINRDYKSNYSGGSQYVAYTCEPRKMLPWLMKQFQSQGGEIKKRKIISLEEIRKEKYNIVINCTGIGARELVHDYLVKPVRGQISRVVAPWVFHTLMEDCEGGNYVIPNIDCVILGGTCQGDDFDESVREDDSKFIHEGCTRMIPTLKRSRILKEWVGLRPKRPNVRLEAEVWTDKNSEDDFIVIHNYGHGGCGVTLSWGCALEVVKILKNQRNLKSKF